MVKQRPMMATTRDLRSEMKAMRLYTLKILFLPHVI